MQNLDHIRAAKSSGPMTTQPAMLGTGVPASTPDTKKEERAPENPKHAFTSLAEDDNFNLRIDTVINLKSENGGIAMAKLAAQLTEDVFNKRDITLLDRFIREANSSSMHQRNAAVTVLYYFTANVAQMLSNAGSTWRSVADVEYCARQGVGYFAPLLGEVIVGIKRMLPGLPKDFKATVYCKGKPISRGR